MFLSFRIGMGIFGICFLSFLQENKIILLEANTRIKSI